MTLLNQAFDTPTVARSAMLQLRRGDILGRALAATGPPFQPVSSWDHVVGAVGSHTGG